MADPGDLIFWKYTSAAAEASKAGILSSNKRGRLVMLQAANSSAAVAYLWVFDATATGGAPLITPVPVPAGGWVDVPLRTADRGHGTKGIPFGTNLTVALSTTFLTFTQLGTANGSFTVGWLGGANP